MKLNRIEVVVAVAIGVLLVCGGLARAQSTVNQGSPGFNPWPVKVTSATGPDGGAVVVQDLPCTSPRDTFFIPSTTDAGTCPPTALAGRRSILLCNAPKNISIATTPFITLTIDGQFPTNTLPSPGQELGLGDCITYLAPDSTTVHCISDTADAGLLITECQ